MGFANIMCSPDPNGIMVGGSAAAHNPFFPERSVEGTQRCLTDPETLHVVPAAFGDSAGLIGAALLLRDPDEDGGHT